MGDLGVPIEGVNGFETSYGLGVSMLYILICRAVRFQKGAQVLGGLCGFYFGSRWGNLAKDRGAACATAWVGRLVKGVGIFPGLIAVHAVKRGTVRGEGGD